MNKHHMFSERKKIKTILKLECFMKKKWEKKVTKIKIK